jgi:vacuolar-type H+-ATPase subunit H
MKETKNKKKGREIYAKRKEHGKEIEKKVIKTGKEKWKRQLSKINKKRCIKGRRI